MSIFTMMKTTVREEALIPTLAVDAFQHAFEYANSTAEIVVYVENQQLLKKLENGDVIVLKDLSHAYESPELKHAVLKRKRKASAMA